MSPGNRNSPIGADRTGLTAFAAFADLSKETKAASNKNHIFGKLAGLRNEIEDIATVMTVSVDQARQHF